MAKITIKAKFGITPNHVLNDQKMSFKAKGLYGYIQSKPENWDFSGDKIALDSTDGRNAVYSGLKELEETGYLERIKRKNNKGQWEIEYILHERKFSGDSFYEENGSTDENQHWEESEKTTAYFPQADFPQADNRQTNKERESKKDIVKSNIESKTKKIEKEIIEIAKDKFPLLSAKLQEFLEYRKSKKKPVSEKGAPAFLRRLEKLSGGNEEIAVEILEISIANEYQGIFPVKGYNINNKNFTSFSQKIGVARA